MHKNRIARSITLGIIFLILITTGCGEKPPWGDLESGLILKYQLPQDQTLTYKISSNTDQKVQAMSQIITSDINYSIKGTGVDEQNNLMLQITINDINLAVKSPVLNLNPDTSNLKGKSYSAVHSPNGNQLEVSGTEDIPKIVLTPGAEQDVKDSFKDILPELPDMPIKTGESWTTPIDRNIEQGPIKMTFKGETTNVFEGIETIQGMECAKIKSQTKTGIEGSGTQMGQSLTLKGDLTATSTWYFAYKKGILVKSTDDTNQDIKINLGPMEIPQISKTKAELELVP